MKTIVENLKAIGFSPDCISDKVGEYIEATRAVNSIVQNHFWESSKRELELSNLKLFCCQLDYWAMRGGEPIRDSVKAALEPMPVEDLQAVLMHLREISELDPCESSDILTLIKMIESKW